MMLEVRSQDPLPLTRCGRFSTPVIVRAALGLGVVWMLLTSHVEPIQAACIPDEASVESGQTVICTDPNAVGYTVPTNIDDVTVEISEGASFELLGDGISINDRGGIVNAGTISVGAGGSTGLIAGDGLEGGDPITIQNAATGSISVLSAGAYGIRVGNFAEIELVEGSTLSLGENATGAVGLLTGTHGQVDHYGEVTVQGTGGRAFELGAGSSFGQEAEPQRTPGTITLSAESSVGISGSENNLILSWGNLESTANQTTGIWLTNPSDTPQTGGTASNRGEMNFSGSGSRGIVSGSYSVSGNTATGTMSFSGPDSTAIESGDIGTSRNQGSIVMDGDESTALRTGNGESLVTGGFPYAENTEDAVIELSGEDSIGIEVGRYGFVENLGEVSVSGSGSTAIRSGAESYILNFGTIRVSGDGSIGVHADGPDQPEPPPPEQDYGVLFNADGASLVSEDPLAGPIIKLEAGSRANRVTNYGASKDGLDTPSLISAYIDPDDPTLNPGVAIQGSDGADHIINGADIRGLVLLGDGDDIYESYLSGQLLTDLGSGTLDGGAGTDLLDLTVDASVSDTKTGFFDLGLMQNFEEVRVSAGTWQVSGRPTEPAGETTDLVVASGGTLRIETPLSIPGDYSHEAPTEPSDPLARVEVVLTAENEGQGEALLQVEGQANLSNGELEIEVVRDLTSGDFPSGDFLLVESGGVLSGEFDSVSEPLGTLTYTEHKLTLELVAMNANQKATSNYIESLPTTGPLESFLDTIKDLNYSEYLSALNQIMPEAYDAQADATLELANQYTDLLLSRPNYCVVKPGEASVHPTTQLACQKRAFEPWMNLYGQRHKRTGTDGHISYHDEGGGLVVGFDHRVNHQLLLTASAGVAYDIIHVDNVGRGRLGTVDIGFAASWADGPLRIQGAATYGYGWNQRYREVDIADFSSRARSEYGMNRVGLRARAEYGFRLGHLQLAPLVSLDYTALIRPSITETEGGAANLYIDGTTNNITTVRVGLDLGSALHKRGYWTELLENADGIWRPQLTVAWRQVVTGAHREITSRLLGAPGNTFTIEADAADRGFEVGAGLDWSPARINRFTFGVHYDAFVWEDVLNQTIMGQVRFSF